MSRSFKHRGWIQDSSSKRYGKRFANKRVRRCLEVSDNAGYRRIYQTYDVCDFIIPSRGKFIATEHRPGRFFLKVVPGGALSPFLFLDFEDHTELWRDWIK